MFLDKSINIYFFIKNSRKTARYMHIWFKKLKNWCFFVCKLHGKFQKKTLERYPRSNHYTRTHKGITEPTVQGLHYSQKLVDMPNFRGINNLSDRQKHRLEFYKDRYRSLEKHRFDFLVSFNYEISSWLDERICELIIFLCLTTMVTVF